MKIKNTEIPFLPYSIEIETKADHEFIFEMLKAVKRDASFVTFSKKINELIDLIIERGNYE